MTTGKAWWGEQIKLHGPWTSSLSVDNGNFAQPLFSFGLVGCVCVQSNSVFASEGPFTPYSVHRILCHLTTSPSSCAALCVFNTVTLFHREGLMRSGRFDSFTSRVGRTTACPIMPRACWGLLGESSPRPWPTRDPWWFTAGSYTTPGSDHLVPDTYVSTLSHKSVCDCACLVSS